MSNIASVHCPKHKLSSASLSHYICDMREKCFTTPHHISEKMGESDGGVEKQYCPMIDDDGNFCINADISKTPFSVDEAGIIIELLI